MPTDPSPPRDPLARPRRRARKRDLPAQYHVLLCTDTSRAACASAKQMKASWRFLKRRIKQLGLRRRVLVSQVPCLGLCCGGPLAVVYPDSAWYGHCRPEVLERIVQEHLLGGTPVEEYLLCRTAGTMPLAYPNSSPSFPPPKPR